MHITLQECIDVDIFESFEILTSKKNLNASFNRISFIEVPDYHRFLVKNSILITTLTSLSYDNTFFITFLSDCHKHHIQCIVIKDKGILPPFSKEVLTYAEKLNIVLLLITSPQTNLSHIMHKLSHMLFTHEHNPSHQTHTFRSLGTLFTKVHSFEDVISQFQTLPDIDLCIRLSENKLYSSSEDLKQYIKHHKSIFKKNFITFNKNVIARLDVLIEDRMYYQFFLQYKTHDHENMYYLSEFVHFLILHVRSQTIDRQKNAQQQLETLFTLLHMQKTDTYHHTYSLTFPKYGIFIFPNTKNISLEDMLLLRNLYETYTHQKRTTYTAFEGNGFLFILQDTIDTIEDKIAHLSKTEFKEKAIRIYCTPHIATSHAIEPIFKEALTFIDILEKIPSLPFITMLADHTILSILLATPKETSITFMKSQLAPFLQKIILIMNSLKHLIH